jgi:thioredoxin 1
MNLETYKERRNCDAAVVFFTAKWCRPCKGMYPLFEELSKRNSLITMFKIDVDESDEVAKYAEIDAMPTFLFYLQGKKVARFSGADPNQLISNYNELLGNARNNF